MGSDQNSQPVNLNKGVPVRLTKGDQATKGELILNVNWTVDGREVDIDCGVLYKMSSFWASSRLFRQLAELFEATIKKGSLQALNPWPSRFGTLKRRPYAKIDKDDRTGGSTDGETIRFNMEELAKLDFAKFVFYAYIYKGARSWDGLNAVATITEPNGKVSTFRLNPATNGTTCAVATLEWYNGGVTLTPLIEPYQSQKVMDRAYGWGLNWGEGTKH